MRIILSILFISFFLSCSSDEEPETCVSFDTRQCMGDPWSEEVDGNASAEVQSEQLKSYLESQGIAVLNVTADLTFHQIVCEACIVCPEGPRFYVDLSVSDSERLKALDPLNFETIECSE